MADYDSRIKEILEKKDGTKASANNCAFEIFKLMCEKLVEYNDKSEEDLLAMFFNSDDFTRILEKACENEKCNQLIEVYKQLDDEIKELEQKEYDDLKNYEKAYSVLINEKSTEEEIENAIKSYCECLKAALENYYNSQLDGEYTLEVYKREDVDAFHAIGEFGYLFSIKQSEVEHLLGLPLDKNNRTSPENKSGYVEYMLEKLKSTNFAQDLLDKFKTDKDIKKSLFDSFLKTINFRKIYEYTLIPEFIIDYDPSEVKDNSAGDYRYRAASLAFTPKKGAVLAVDSEVRKAFVVFLNNTFGEKIILNDSTPIYCTENSENGSMTIALPIVDKNKTGNLINITGYTGKKSNFLQFNCYETKESEYEFKIDLPPSIFLASYDKEKFKDEEIKANISIIMAYLIYARLIAIDLLNEAQFDKSTEVTTSIENIDDYIDKYVKAILNPTESDASIDFAEEIAMYPEKLYEKVLDPNKLMEFIKYFIKDMRKSKSSNNISEKSPEEKALYDLFNSWLSITSIKDLDLNLDNWTGEQIKDVEKALFRLSPDLRSIVTKMPKAVSDSLPADFSDFIVAKQINVSQIVSLAQRIYDKIEGNDLSKIDRSISMVGLSSYRDGSEEMQNFKYSKTFMGKTPVQLIADLRINGFAYKVGGIRGNRKLLRILSLSDNPKLVHKISDKVDQINKEREENTNISEANYNNQLLELENQFENRKDNLAEWINKCIVVKTFPKDELKNKINSVLKDYIRLVEIKNEYNEDLDKATEILRYVDNLDKLNEAYNNQIISRDVYEQTVTQKFEEVRDLCYSLGNGRGKGSR